MKLLGSTESKITRDKNGEHIPPLEITKVVLVHCKMIKNYYQQDSITFYTFVPYKSFGTLFEISPINSIFLKTFQSGFSYIEEWFTDQNSELLEIEDRINLTLVIKWYSHYKNALFNRT